MGDNDFRRTMPRFAGAALEANQAVVDAVVSVADTVGATPAHRLRWHGCVSADDLGVAAVPIPGTRRAARVDENLASLSVTLTAEQVSVLRDAGNAVTGARYADMSAIGSSGDSSSDDSAP